MLTKLNLQNSIAKSSRYLLIIGVAGLMTTLEPVLAQVSTPTSPSGKVPALTPSPSPSGKVPTPIPEATEYTLGDGDKVLVTVYQVADFSGEFLVLPDGTLTLPLIGTIKVEGMTVTRASQTISKRYTTYLKRPIVTVSLLTPRPLQIAVAGEVNNPGTYTITLQETLKAPLLTDLLRKAGGVTTVADISQVQIRRDVNGKENIMQANLWDLIQKGDKNQDVSLRDGDSILIPTKTTLNVAETRQLADANFGLDSDRELNVTVVGEVYRPGAYRIVPAQINNASNETNLPRRQPARLTKAVQLAGGIKPLADIRQIEVRRYNRDGSQQTIPVDLWTLLDKGDMNADLILQEGDTVIVPTATALSPKESETLASASFSPATIRVKVVGEVKQPGVMEVPPNTPLNQAILTAGDFDKRRANQSVVELIRLNPNGTVTKKSIAVDFSQGINEEKNPTLQNNDVIVVNRSDLTAATDTLSTIVSPLGSALGLLNVYSIFK
jgi:polysaccharide export outer membrane protein